MFVILPSQPKADDKVEEEKDEEGMWEETFKSHTDTKPNGTTATSSPAGAAWCCQASKHLRLIIILLCLMSFTNTTTALPKVKDIPC